MYSIFSLTSFNNRDGDPVYSSQHFSRATDMHGPVTVVSQRDRRETELALPEALEDGQPCGVFQDAVDRISCPESQVH